MVNKPSWASSHQEFLKRDGKANFYSRIYVPQRSDACNQG